MSLVVQISPRYPAARTFWLQKSISSRLRHFVCWSSFLPIWSDSPCMSLTRRPCGGLFRWKCRCFWTRVRRIFDVMLLLCLILPRNLFSTRSPELYAHDDAHYGLVLGKGCKRRSFSRAGDSEIAVAVDFRLLHSAHFPRISGRIFLHFRGEFCFSYFSRRFSFFTLHKAKLSHQKSQEIFLTIFAFVCAVTALFLLMSGTFLLRKVRIGQRLQSSTHSKFQQSISLYIISELVCWLVFIIYFLFVEE